MTVSANLEEANAFLLEGNALRAAGRPAQAAESYRKAMAAAPEHCAVHYSLALAMSDMARPREAAISFRDAARFAHSSGFPAVHGRSIHAATSLIAEGIGRGDAPLFQPPALPAKRGDAKAVSIVVCSIQPQRYAAMHDNFTQSLGSRPHEFIRIGDARSLCEGYNRGLAQARFDHVVFSHDDVELLSDDPFAAIQAALESHDVVGFMGTTQVGGPAVQWTGHPTLRGFVAMPSTGQPGTYDAALYSLDCGVMGSMQALDGFCFAARRDAAVATGFDAATFDGFHFYDLDFTYRAHLAGLRVAVTTDAVAVHKSLGQFGDDWKRYADRFRAKFPALGGERGSNEFHGMRFTSREATLRFYDEVRGLAAIPASSG